MIEPLVLLRALHFAATLSASGTVFFLVLAAGPAARTAEFAALRRRLVWWVWLSLGAAVLTGAAWLVWLASDILGASIADVFLEGGAWSVLEGTRFGEVWSLRGALALLLGLLMPWPGTRWLQVACAAAFAALPALVGHAGATPGAVVPVAADMAHLLAAAAWVGGLPALATVLAHRSQGITPGTIARITERFSRLAMASVAVLLASGIANGWNLLAGPADLLMTPYGRLISLKLGLFAAMVGWGAVNRLHWTPRLEQPRARRALRRNSLAEIGLALGALLLVGLLGITPPTAHRHETGTVIPDGAAFVHIHSTEAMAEITLNPGRAGTTHATIRVMHEDSSQFPAREIGLDLEPPTPDLPKINRLAARSADGTWQVENIDLPRPGIWTAKVTITPLTGAPIVLDAPMVIEPGS